jgi:hypothetical protein
MMEQSDQAGEIRETREIDEVGDDRVKREILDLVGAVGSVDIGTIYRIVREAVGGAARNLQVADSLVRLVRAGLIAIRPVRIGSDPHAPLIGVVSAATPPVPAVQQVAHPPHPGTAWPGRRLVTLFGSRIPGRCEHVPRRRVAGGTIGDRCRGARALRRTAHGVAR